MHCIFGNIIAVTSSYSETAAQTVTTAVVYEVAGGTCGENLTWELNSEGTLNVSGIQASF